MTEIHVRASSMPLAALCAASVEPTEIKIVGDPEAADLGRAAHHVLTQGAIGAYVEIEDAAAMFGVDPGELGMLCRWGRKAWSRVARWFPSPEIEVPLTNVGFNVRLSGHVDILSFADGEVRIADLKTGRLDLDHTEQLMAYAYLAINAWHPEAVAAYAVCLRVRDQIADGFHWSRQELESWWQRFLRHISEREVYHAGSHCGHCPRGHTCKAKTMLLAQAVDSLTDGHTTLALASAAKLQEPTKGFALANVLERVKLVENFCKDARAIIKAEVRQAGGTIDAGDGRQLEIIAQDQTEILPAEAWPILCGEIGEPTLIECIDIGKGKVEKAVKATAGHGQKGRAVTDLFRRLDEAGATAKHTVERLEIRRSGKGIEAEHGDTTKAISTDADAGAGEAL